MLTIALLAFAASCRVAPTCTCGRAMEPTSPAAMASRLKFEAAVFEGQVVRVRFAPDSGLLRDSTKASRGILPTNLVATFRVTRAWKGAIEDSVVVSTSALMCSFDFVEGHRYLVFAYPRLYNGVGVVPPADRSTILFTGMCGLTREVDARALELERLLSARGAESERPR
jgi:hypothetical protein